MNTAEIYGAYGVGLALAGLLVHGFATGWLVLSFSFAVKVVPPWSRKPPERQKAVTQKQPRDANGRYAPAGVPSLARGDRAA